MSQRLRDGSRQLWWFRRFAVFGSLCMVGLICAETGVTSTTIKIGQSAALTGPSAALVVEMRSAIAAYFNAVNSSGGIHGRQLELIALDDGYRPYVIRTEGRFPQQRTSRMESYSRISNAAAAAPQQQRPRPQQRLRFALGGTQCSVRNLRSS